MMKDSRLKSGSCAFNHAHFGVVCYLKTNTSKVATAYPHIRLDESSFTHTINMRKN